MQLEAKLACALPPFGEPLENRFGHPSSGTVEQRRAFVGMGEAGIDDDAIGIVTRGHVARPRHGGEDIDAEVPLQIERHGLDGVGRARPLRHRQSGLLDDLAGETVHRILVQLDDTTGRRPVGLAVPSEVLDEQEPTIELHQTGRDAPATQPGCVGLRTGRRQCAHLPILAETPIQRNRHAVSQRSRSPGAVRTTRTSPYPGAMHRNAAAVTEAGRTLGLDVHVVEYAAEGARTALDAAAAIGVEVGQIVKSLVFAVGDPKDRSHGEPVVALVCGDDQLDEARLANAAGAEGAWRIDAKAVRDATGFAVGGIPPFGHATPMRVFADRRLRRFDEVWAAAGTPSHVFAVEVTALVEKTGAIWAEMARVTPVPAPASATLAVTHPRPTGRNVLGTIPMTARPPQLSALPSVAARGLAFAAILLGGLMGGLLTYGVRKVMTGKTTGTSLGLWTVVGAVGTAFGVGVLVTLVLRAMGEWRGLNRPEDTSTVLGGS